MDKPKIRIVGYQAGMRSLNCRQENDDVTPQRFDWYYGEEDTEIIVYVEHMTNPGAIGVPNTRYWIFPVIAWRKILRYWMREFLCGLGRVNSVPPHYFHLTSTDFVVDD